MKGVNIGSEAGEVTYDEPLPTEPQFLLTNTGAGRTFEIRYVEKIDKPDKLYKRRRSHQKYWRDKSKPIFSTAKSFGSEKCRLRLAQPICG
ncbi:MAG: hypothetical protein ACR2G5_07235 [Pyrinomonadaceae bacterium]